MKKYNIKPSKKQLKIMKKYWDKLVQIESSFGQAVCKLEEDMQREIEIDDLEFFACDGEFVGIGNANRTMKLIQWR